VKGVAKLSQQNLYSVFLDYNGGTYISQVFATSHDVALSKWIPKLKTPELKKWAITKAVLTQIIKNQMPVPVRGCMNIWCVTGTHKNRLALINIVATASKE
jgi:hypothetical protein